MNEMAAVRFILAELREEAGLSQSELAKRLDCASSRISRLESGELQLTLSEAAQIANKIGESYPKAKYFAEYLTWEWKALNPPGFRHISLVHLRKAEVDLQQLDAILGDPDIKNAFAQQIRSCRDGILRAATYLHNTEHGVAMIGPPRVGKTTGTSAVADLRDLTQEKLADQMVLQTGGGRVTACEVHVISGDEFAINVEPCSPDELRQFVSELCDDLLQDPDKNGKVKVGDTGKLPIEVDRVIRNMADLPRPHSRRGPDGTMVAPEDPAEKLAREHPTKDELLVEIMTRLELPRRTRTAIRFSSDAPSSGLKWLKQVFRQINFGLHKEFSLPRRIEVVVPHAMLGESSISVRLIDTRGNDEPSAPRRDLQNYLDDPRTAIVLCSSFGDAPDAASQVMIERCAELFARNPLTAKGLLLVLAQGDVEKEVLDQSTGESVGSAEEGREIRARETRSKLNQMGASFLPVAFLNAIHLKDCDAMKKRLVELIKSMRRQYEQQIDELSDAVRELVGNKEYSELRAVFDDAVRPLQIWFEQHQEIAVDGKPVESTLIRDMRDIRHAGTLRASVNRRGVWDNFDFWLGLGQGARQHAVSRSVKSLTTLRDLVQIALATPEHAPVHGFLKHFRNQIDDAVTEFEQQVQILGETAFSVQLRNDGDYWAKCQNRWGQGKGYKDEVTHWTNGWFKDKSEGRKERYEYIEREVRRRWREMLARLSTHLQSGDAVLVPAAS